jgi:hypothetical protein
MEVQPRFERGGTLDVREKGWRSPEPLFMNASFFSNQASANCLAGVFKSEKYDLLNQMRFFPVAAPHARLTTR